MDRETKTEVIKALASGMTDEQIANFADMTMEELQSFKEENAKEITARRGLMEGFGL